MLNTVINSLYAKSHLIFYYFPTEAVKLLECDIWGINSTPYGESLSKRWSFEDKVSILLDLSLAVRNLGVIIVGLQVVDSKIGTGSLPWLTIP